MLAQTPPGEVRELDWFFAGQANHERRRKLVATLLGLPGGRLKETAGFAQGFDRVDYLALMAQAKVVPCPSGPATPDSFRVWEALEAGCIPVVDEDCPAYNTPGFWELLLGEKPPFPTVTDWSTFPAVLDGLLDGWPDNTAIIQAWYRDYKQRLAGRIVADIQEVACG
jgi:hypothetical protein